MSNPYYPLHQQQLQAQMVMQMPSMQLPYSFSGRQEMYTQEQLNDLQIDPQMTGLIDSGAPPPVLERKKRGRKPGRKLKANSPMKMDGSDDDEEDEDDEFNLEGTKTKFGRKVHRPSQYAVSLDDEKPARRRAPNRKVNDMRMCRVCHRGHSPKSNMIVFCDSCNLPYHQRCHDPPIDDMLVEVEDAEWFCKDCVSKRSDRVLETGMTGKELSKEEKRRYLATLSMSQLVELLFFCEQRHTDIPFYSPNTKEILENLNQAAQTAAEKAEQDTDGTAIPKTRSISSYPAPGNGIQLPDEFMDEACLVDDNHGEFFSVQIFN